MESNTKIEIINKEKKRIDYFDIAKGIGIILMILGHMSLQNKYLKNFLYTFHMPLFFIISGYFFRYRENKICIKNIIKKLIIPYTLTCIIIIFYKVFRLLLDGNFSDITNTIKVWGLASIYGSGYGIRYGIQFIGAIWFLLALGFATYIMNLIYNQKYRYLWVLLIAYVGYKTSTYIWLPLSIQVGMVALVFVYIGVLVRENDLFNTKIPIILYLFLIFIMVFCTKYCGNIDMVRNYYNDGLIDFIGGLSGTFLCIKISMIIDKYTKMLSKMFAFIGRNSLLCMCIHLFSLDCLNWITINNLLENIGIYRQDIRNIIINFSFVFLILMIIKIIQRIGIKLKERMIMIN